MNEEVFVFIVVVQSGLVGASIQAERKGTQTQVGWGGIIIFMVVVFLRQEGARGVLFTGSMKKISRSKL